MPVVSVQEIYAIKRIKTHFSLLNFLSQHSCELERSVKVSDLVIAEDFIIFYLKGGGGGGGECISVFSLCGGWCFSSAPGLVPGYSWCEESQQCLPHGIKCRVLWGVGCGDESYFCWRGNVCLPKSIPCNGK